MITLPIESSPASRVLVIGRSEPVLSETVRILRRKGHAAGASNDFDHALTLFDMAAVDVVVFGGMVPPETKEHLRQQIKGRNPEVVFVQGFAGIPGLIAGQVEAALTAVNSAEVRPVATYATETRTVTLQLDRPESVQVVAWWGTSFTPPDPRSTFRIVVGAEFPAGQHTVKLPEEVPSQASFVTVTVGDAVQAFIAGSMPRGTTMASFPPPSTAS
jgi:hypothetical protein